MQRNVKSVLNKLERSGINYSFIKWTLVFRSITTKQLQSLTEPIGDWLDSHYGKYPSAFEFEYSASGRRRDLRILLRDQPTVEQLELIFKECLRLAKAIGAEKIEFEIDTLDFTEADNGGTTDSIAPKWTEGFYAFNEGSNFTHYLRMYSDLNILYAYDMSKPENLAKWMVLGARIPCGTYSLDGHQINAELMIRGQPGLGKITFKGEFVSNGLQLEIKSKSFGKGKMFFRRILQ